MKRYWADFVLGSKRTRRRHAEENWTRSLLNWRYHPKKIFSALHGIPTCLRLRPEVYYRYELQTLRRRLWSRTGLMNWYLPRSMCWVKRPHIFVCSVETCGFMSALSSVHETVWVLSDVPIYVSFNTKPSLTADRRNAISRYTKSTSTFCFLGLAHQMSQQVLCFFFRLLTIAWRLVNMLLKIFWICTKCTPHILKLDRLRYAFLGIRRTRFERMASCYKLSWNGHSLYETWESFTMVGYWQV